MSSRDYYGGQQNYPPPQGVCCQLESGPTGYCGGYYPQQPQQPQQAYGYGGQPPYGQQPYGGQQQPMYGGQQQPVYIQQPQNSGGGGGGCMACLAGMCLCCALEGGHVAYSDKWLYSRLLRPGNIQTSVNACSKGTRVTRFS
ncbi:hypothetical protein M0805_006542 [Coniferiporia weirii]|nr:hypothetical protein M0805_006542 [Coniferiporia weirii]